MESKGPRVFFVAHLSKLYYLPAAPGDPTDIIQG